MLFHGILIKSLQAHTDVLGRFMPLNPVCADEGPLTFMERILHHEEIDCIHDSRHDGLVSGRRVPRAA